MHIHILGICGTFMGSLAQLAKAMGHQVSGCDANVYPPMSNQLEQAGIKLIERLGAQVTLAAFIIDLPALGGRKKIEGLGVPTHVLCEFEGL